MNGISKKKCPSCGEPLIEESFGKPQCYNDRCSDGGETLEAQRHSLSYRGNGCGCLAIIINLALLLIAVHICMYFWGFSCQ